MRRVLVVDDNEENAYYLTALLSAHGFEVVTARHGAEALIKARQHPPALVISDLLMPVMDGYTLLRHWKLDERLRRVPFIVYTATYTAPEDEQLALSLGADAFILKPAEPEDFMARVRQVETGAKPAPTKQPSGDEAQLLRDYSRTLIRKLEEKTLQLEESNQQLQRDIAARARTEAALRESEERFRQLAENIDDVLWLSDLAGRIVYVSPAYTEVWGRRREDLYAAPATWFDAIHADDRARVMCARDDQARGTWDETFRVVRPDGAIRWVRARAYPVRDAQGQVYRVAGVARDITAYRKLEEQLRQSQKMEAIGQLAGGVAHDFNNLLTVILSYASLALGELRADAPGRADIEEIRRAGLRAMDLTRQLLAFGRQQMLRPRVLDLGQVVRGLESLLRRLVGEDVTLALRTEGAASRVYADPTQIEQIVMNLVVNARDAMPRGGTLAVEVTDVDDAAVRAALQTDVEPGRYVMLAVTDTGVGMDAPTRERIFEPFFTTKAQGKGTGLGLSTVFGIVKQSGGHIHVESEPGLGATFRVYLPSTSQAVEAVKPAVVVPSTLRGTETILLVEDDDQVREVHRTVLRRNGYTVLDAQNGGEAFLLSERLRGTIHLLLADVVLPRMSGPELAERIGAMRPGLRVLYISGYARDAVVQHGVADAGLAFLAKPIEPEALLRRVREVLDAPA